jgi:hypothetical protein
MENLQRFEQPPTAVNVTVAKRRPREYLTKREIERLMKAAEDRVMNGPRSTQRASDSGHPHQHSSPLKADIAQRPSRVRAAVSRCSNASVQKARLARSPIFGIRHKPRYGICLLVNGFTSIVDRITRFAACICCMLSKNNENNRER